MQKAFLVLVGVALIAQACFSKYKYTVNLCEGRYYAEVYNINPVGVDDEYLTDSATFKVYVGRFDNEHEIFKYRCKGDSIEILKYAEDYTGKYMPVETRELSIIDLLKREKQIKTPIFEIK